MESMRAKKKRSIPTPEALVSILDDQRLRELVAIIANPPEDFASVMVGRNQQCQQGHK